MAVKGDCIEIRVSTFIQRNAYDTMHGRVLWIFVWHLTFLRIWGGGATVIL
jgi:hypothetical protein